MNVRDIVRKAWQMTQVHLKKLMWYGFVPSFFGIIVSSAYLLYQYNAFKHSDLFGPQTEKTDVMGLAKGLWDIAYSHPATSITLLVLSLLIFVGYMLTPPIFGGTLIHALTKISKYESIEGSVEIGVRRFFHMFEFGLLSGSFSVMTLFTESSFILRWWGQNIFFAALPILLFIAVAGLIINFLFTYAEYYIVLHDRGITQSIMESCILVISNLKKTILVFVLMMLIGLRIVLNVLLVLLIPMVVVVFGSYLATLFLSALTIFFIGLVALVVLIVSSYLLGLFHIFATAVWVLTFAELTEKPEEAKEVQIAPQNA